jgi:pyrroloquinoline-quinone synthase
MSGDVEARLLAVMDRKDHWAWPHFTRPGLSKRQLLVHFRHEFHTYVHDFPVLLARVLGQGPPEDVRAALAQNIDEEQTGQLSMHVSHPELFLEMMEGLGIDRRDVLAREPALEPEAIAYRAFLDRVSASPPWIVGAAVLTIFVEGSVHERAERLGKRELPPIEEAISAHPMVRHYGCPPSAMRLARVHRAIEGNHRDDAWEMLLKHCPPEGPLAAAIVDAVESAHRAWLSYRDSVARAMGLTR